jgi:hypothetical protein
MPEQPQHLLISDHLRRTKARLTHRLPTPSGRGLLTSITRDSETGRTMTPSMDETNMHDLSYECNNEFNKAAIFLYKINSD